MYLHRSLNLNLVVFTTHNSRLTLYCYKPFLGYYSVNVATFSTAWALWAPGRFEYCPSVPLPWLVSSLTESQSFAAWWSGRLGAWTSAQARWLNWPVWDVNRPHILADKTGQCICNRRLPCCGNPGDDALERSFVPACSGNGSSDCPLSSGYSFWSGVSYEPCVFCTKQCLFCVSICWKKTKWLFCVSQNIYNRLFILCKIPLSIAKFSN